MSDGQISDSARQCAEEDYRHMPDDERRLVAQALTRIEEATAGYSPDPGAPYVNQRRVFETLIRPWKLAIMRAEVRHPQPAQLDSVGR